jgi:hypothetical protein
MQAISLYHIRLSHNEFQNFSDIYENSNNNTIHVLAIALLTTLQMSLNSIKC